MNLVVVQRETLCLRRLLFTPMLPFPANSQRQQRPIEYSTCMNKKRKLLKKPQITIDIDISDSDHEVASGLDEQSGSQNSSMLDVDVVAKSAGLVVVSHAETVDATPVHTIAHGQNYKKTKHISGKETLSKDAEKTRQSKPNDKHQKMDMMKEAIVRSKEGPKRNLVNLSATQKAKPDENHKHMLNPRKRNSKVLRQSARSLEPKQSSKSVTQSSRNVVGEPKQIRHRAEARYRVLHRHPVELQKHIPRPDFERSMSSAILSRSCLYQRNNPEIARIIRSEYGQESASSEPKQWYQVELKSGGICWLEDSYISPVFDNAALTNLKCKRPSINLVGVQDEVVWILRTEYGQESASSKPERWYQVEHKSGRISWMPRSAILNHPLLPEFHKRPISAILEERHVSPLRPLSPSSSMVAQSPSSRSSHSTGAEISNIIQSEYRKNNSSGKDGRWYQVYMTSGMITWMHRDDILHHPLLPKFHNPSVSEICVETSGISETMDEQSDSSSDVTEQSYNSSASEIIRIIRSEYGQECAASDPGRWYEVEWTSGDISWVPRSEILDNPLLPEFHNPTIALDSPIDQSVSTAKGTDLRMVLKSKHKVLSSWEGNFSSLEDGIL